MARNGSGVYSAPAGTAAVSGDPISSSKFNTLVNDLVNDANDPRPVVAGGTGASSASAARTNLGLGNAATKTVQTANDDATAGRVLLPGAFGWGETGASVTLADIDDTAKPSGAYTYDGTTTGTKPTGAEGSGTLSWQKQGAQGGCQTLVGTSGASVFTRTATSNVWSAWRRLDTPAGAVQAFAMTTVPAGWLECDGSDVSRTTYAGLFAAIGTTFGSGDGSTTFGLPDLRGEFVRGWDHGREVDVGRTFGSSQADALKSHKHPLAPSVLTNTGASQRGVTGAPVGASSETGATGGTETRPRNIALMYCIKA